MHLDSNFKVFIHFHYGMCSLGKDDYNPKLMGDLNNFWAYEWKKTWFMFAVNIEYGKVFRSCHELSKFERVAFSNAGFAPSTYARAHDIKNAIYWETKLTLKIDCNPNLTNPFKKKMQLHKIFFCIRKDASAAYNCNYSRRKCGTQPVLIPKPESKSGNDEL